MRSHGSSFLISYREARGHAIIVAALGWLGVVAFAGLGRGDRSGFGPLKWSDFVHFYTLGDVARARDGDLLYDGPRLHERQTALVPASGADDFVAVYGPQTALIFAPLSFLPYVAAGALWALMTLAIYAWSLWLAWRPAREALRDRPFLIAAALAFPPAWQVAMYGQTTAVLLVAFAGAMWAFERERSFLAGVALSLIAVKPQWGLALAAVAILTRDWRLIAGGLAGLGLQILAVLAVFDRSVLPAYARTLRRMPAVTSLLEPDAYKLHSVRALTRLLPASLDWIVWGVLAAVATWAAARFWRDERYPRRVRFGIVVIASALINPHLTVYDVTVLALPVLWIGGWLASQPGDSAWFWQRCYWISVFLLLPSARLISIQLTPILIGELLFQLVRRSPDFARISHRG